MFQGQDGWQRVFGEGGVELFDTSIQSVVSRHEDLPIFAVEEYQLPLPGHMMDTKARLQIFLWRTTKIVIRTIKVC